MKFSSNSSSDNEVPSCSKACSKAYAQLHAQYDKLTDEFRKSQFDVISYQTGLESVEATLLVYKQNESVFEENIKLLNIEVQLRDIALVTLRQKLEKAKQERDDLKLKLDKFQPSGGYHVVPPPITGTFMPPKPNLVFNTAPTAVETDHHAFNVSDSEDESKTKALQFAPSFVQSSKHVKSPRHTVQPIETSILAATPALATLKSTSSGKIRNRKTCFVCKSVDHLIKDCDYHAKKMAQNTQRNYAHKGDHKQPVSAVVPQIMVTRPRYAHQVVTKSKSPIRRHITRSPSPKTSNLPFRVTAAQALVGNPQYALKDKGVIDRDAQGNMSYLSDFEELNGGYIAFGGIDSGCSRHMTWNMSYLSDFKELNGGYVAFGGNPRVLPDENQVLLRVPKENNMYNVNLKNIVPSGDLTCLFAKETIDESNLWHRRMGHINFKTINKLVKDSLLPIPFWAEAVNTACYVQNRVLVTKPHNKTLYELLHGRTPSISFMRPFGCHVTILNTLDSLGKFKGNVDEGFLVGYSVNSKAFRVFNSRTRIVQETLHVNFLENKPNLAGRGPTWLFDIDSLTRTMNYQPVNARNQTNLSAGFQDKFDAEKAEEEIDQQYVLFPMWSSSFTNPHNNDGDAAFDDKEHDFDVKKPESEVILSPSSSAQSRKQDDKTNKEAKGKIPTVGQNSLNSTNTFSVAGPSNLDDITYSDDENAVGVEDDFNNLETSITVSPVPTTRIHKDHPVSQIIGDLRNPKVHQALKDPSWIKAMQEELLQFKMQKVWVLVDLPHGKRATGFEDPDHPDKVYKVVKTLYGLHQAPRAWYETLATYLLENGFKGGTIDQTLCIKKQKGDIMLVQIYVDDIIFGATNKDLCKSFEKLMKDKFQMSSMGELTFFLGLQVKQKKDGIFISQDKYVAEILRRFGLTEGKSASTPIDTEKPLLKGPDGEDVDVHTYILMIGSLMYLTSSRPDIMFVVCACACFQVTPKASHLHTVKRIFRYLKGKQHLGLWYPKDSPFDLVAYSDSDYAGASLDRKSTTRGCQFFRRRLISW
nr:uncharacterized mitochondrial protein AtMg00810-like [Tanacetum cinerariifolium]